MKIIKCPLIARDNPIIPVIYWHTGSKVSWVMGLVYFDHHAKQDVLHSWYICMDNTNRVVRRYGENY